MCQVLEGFPLRIEFATVRPYSDRGSATVEQAIPLRYLTSRILAIVAQVSCSEEDTEQSDIWSEFS